MQANLDGALPSSQPEDQGVTSPAILRMVEALDKHMHEVHSFMLLRHGAVIAEGWWSPYQAEARHLLFSVSKSFTSTAVGLAIAEGRLSMDDPVLAFFPEQRPAEVSAYLAALTVRDVLTMTTGHVDDTWPMEIAAPDGDWIKAFLNVPITHPPGTHFLYNTGATYILAAIVQQVTGMKLLDYLQPRLFDPLGIPGGTWQESPQGIAVGGYGLSLTTEALARFGQLYLQKGRWGDQQILPEAWVEAATSALVSNGNSDMASDWTQGYGYQFWRCRHGAYQASGVFGQCCIVMPEQDAVLVFTSGIDIFEVQELLDIVWDNLLPGFALEPLPEDATAQAQLSEKLASLSFAPLTNTVAPPALRGRTYEVDANALDIASITLDFNNVGGVFTFNTPRGAQTIAWGYGAWRQGEIDLFKEVWLSEGLAPVVASGGWASADRFRMIVRLVETPFYYTLTFHFMEDDLLFEVQVNVTMDVPKPLLLTAHAALGVVL